MQTETIDRALDEYARSASLKSLSEITSALYKEDQECPETALFLKLLEKTDPMMQMRLGLLYLNGTYLLPNRQKGMNLLSAAASRGVLEARLRLGEEFFNEGEYLKAEEYLSPCMERKNELPEKDLGECFYCYGSTLLCKIQPDIKAGVTHLRVAADEYHHTEASKLLYSLFKDPGNDLFNAQNAMHYLEVAARAGDTEAAEEYAGLLAFGSTEMELKGDYEAALEYLKDYEDSDSPTLHYLLGLIYLNKEPKYRQEALQHFLISDQLDGTNPYCWSYLGYMYGLLFNVDKMKEYLEKAFSANVYLHSEYLANWEHDLDTDLALQYYDAAYSSGNLSTILGFYYYATILVRRESYSKAYQIAEEGKKRFNDVGFFYIMSKLVLEDKVHTEMTKDEAADHMECSISMDHEAKDACLILGIYYLNSREYRKAESTLLKAFSLGNAEAGVGLGILYEHGGGSVAQNVNKAFEWYSTAAAAGSETGIREAACFKKGLFGKYRRIQ